MEQVKHAALQRAVQLLNAAGVQYAIIAPDGMKYGELEVRTEQCGPTRKKSGIRYDVLWKPAFKTLQAGEVAVFDLPAGATLDGLQSAISGAASYTFGRGNAITSRNPNNQTVEVLRVN